MTPLPALPSTTIQLNDAALVEESLRGDQKAFGQLVNRYLPVVYSSLYRLTQNHEMSEEMAQEAFVKAYQNLHSFDRSRHFKPWLLRIASNATISALRKQSRLVSLNAMEDDGAWSEAEHQPVEDASILLERQLCSEEVLRAMERLDEKYRQVLLLRYQQELSYEEIAQCLNIPLNTIRTWLKRGLDKLKNELKEMATDA